jgi:CheY-like chemotaxis protein
VNELRGGPLQGIHVLVVEDDAASRDVLRRALEPMGALVTATTGEAALRAALRADVIVCDLETVESLGREFLPQLQRLHNRRNRPVATVALVPLGIETPATARAAGVQRYLVKPAEPEQLRAAVRELTQD